MGHYLARFLSVLLAILLPVIFLAGLAGVVISLRDLFVLATAEEIAQMGFQGFDPVITMVHPGTSLGLSTLVMIVISALAD